MHLDDAESEKLKKWIIKKLEDISDADSDVLADYVLALAKTDDPEAVARRSCVENLRDFLLDNAEPFVDELFRAIAAKSFDPTRPTPKPAPAEQPRRPNESRKRAYHDWDADDTPGSNGRIQSFQGGERPVKQARRGGRGNDQRGGWQTHKQRHAFPTQHMPQLPAPPPGMPQIDPNNPMAALFAMQQAMGLLSGMPNGGTSSNGGAGRCRDYDTKGFCAAGASCPYEHGNDHFVIPRVDQEYDPSNAALLDVTPSRVGQVNVSRNDRGRGAGRGRGRGRGGRGRGLRSDLSHVGPMRDSSATSIVVEQIPEDKCDEQTVRDFFSEFGDIEEVEMQAHKRLAVVKYSTHEAAQAAYDSPKVVFDNRFVKIYWYKPEKQAKSSHDKRRSTTTKDGDIEMEDEDRLDPEEFAKHQEEAQRKHEESKKQREETARQRQDVDAKLKEMEAERKKMTDMLLKKSRGLSPPAADSETMEDAEDTEQTKALKAQLAKLEAEAKSLGIDPDAPTNGTNDYSGYRGRGGFRGRARGRGHHSGYRGGWAGPGNRAGAVMRLDNRPKTVCLTFLEGAYDHHDEALRQFLLFNSMDSASIAKHPERDDAALIKFNQRYEGENFMAIASSSELLHIGKVEMSWYQEPITATTNGHHDADAAAKVVITENSDQPSPDKPEADQTVAYEEPADDEDLDRWS